ncbi:bis(5'-nucleosyl)-tetraphosphatase (symmetrical) YqeK [Clostridium minihomine]|uniref:bis(5'-nucleosyl)-tetraphosphatase (symmetrical) YqeK n=1 Tax=Clostridium minihomine TaxID=2045012 RepID=UPI000C793717|nr:bis(5'-nucleosyl)-tetraphosphatase (symmetrical) YqeK [Clostridium minihomine]
MDVIQYEELIRQRLSQKRFAHSMNVAVESRRLAQRCGADPEKAYLAGVLHDVMKEAPPEEQLKIMEGSGIMLTDVEKGAQKLWHAMAGAVYLQKVLGITDPEVIHAVRYHTTGRENMSLLEQVVFVADFISAEREYDGVEEMRAAAQNGLEEAVLAGLVFTIQDLSQQGKPIHPDSLAAYNTMILARHGE